LCILFDMYNASYYQVLYIYLFGQRVINAQIPYITWKGFFSYLFKTPFTLCNCWYNQLYQIFLPCILTFSSCTNRLHVGLQVSNMLNTCNPSCNRIMQPVWQTMQMRQPPASNQGPAVDSMSSRMHAARSVAQIKDPGPDRPDAHLHSERR
jgi:hypothetical protein